MFTMLCGLPQPDSVCSLVLQCFACRVTCTQQMPVVNLWKEAKQCPVAAAPKLHVLGPYSTDHALP